MHLLKYATVIWLGVMALLVNRVVRVQAATVSVRCWRVDSSSRSEAASDGDVISVAAGTYVEDINFRRQGHHRRRGGLRLRP